MGNKVSKTSVFLYDTIWERVLWCVGTFPDISETFARCKELAEGMGKQDAFMIPDEENGVVFFDSPKRSRFCFKIKIELEETNTKEDKIRAF